MASGSTGAVVAVGAGSGRTGAEATTENAAAGGRTNESMGPSDAGGVDCEAMRSATLIILSEAAANAPLACTAQSDCSLYATRPKCVYDCGFFAAAADPRSIEAAVDRVDAELCPEECVQVPSSCGGGTAMEDTQVARCEAGECALRDWRSVFQPSFEAIVYPILTSHCQECHGSANDHDGLPFADPDVAVALGTTNSLLNWQLDVRRWRMLAPESSALVQALSARNHNCWSDDCSADADELSAALRAWSESADQ